MEGEEQLKPGAYRTTRADFIQRLQRDLDQRRIETTFAVTTPIFESGGHINGGFFQHRSLAFDPGAEHPTVTEWAEKFFTSRPWRSPEKEDEALGLKPGRSRVTVSTPDGTKYEGMLKEIKYPEPDYSFGASRGDYVSISRPAEHEITVVIDRKITPTPPPVAEESEEQIMDYPNVSAEYVDRARRVDFFKEVEPNVFEDGEGTAIERAPGEEKPVWKTMPIEDFGPMMNAARRTPAWDAQRDGFHTS